MESSLVLVDSGALQAPELSEPWRAFGDLRQKSRQNRCIFSTIELVNALEQEKAKGKAGQIAEGLTRLDLVILDELGYLTFSPSRAGRFCSIC